MMLERYAQHPPQRVPTFTQEPPSFRINGGMAVLIERLAAQLSPEQIKLNHCVKRVEHDPDAVVIHAMSAGGIESTWRCRRLIVAMPPRLAAETIAFSPGLPASLERAMRQTSTWMAGQAKYVAVYPRPFWRDDGLSGAARSAVGPLVEIHDASIPNGPAALFGFVGLSAAQRQAAGSAWEASSLAQLVRLFGADAGCPVAVHIQDWAQSPLTATALDWPPLTTHPNYGAMPDAGPVWRDRLLWAGTETAPDHGGYLEGALEAAERVAATFR
jgi:monoamine oxidase